VLSPGERNPHAGPDFFNARIRFKGFIWSGNVEIHLRSSQWKAHKHDRDPAYNNVILHVVLVEDAVCFTASGLQVPCLILEARSIPERAGQRSRAGFIPCGNAICRLPAQERAAFLRSLLRERCKQKQDRVLHLFRRNHFNWERSLQLCLAAAFGLHINAQAFECLLRGIPSPLLMKHRDDRIRLEALLYGRAGLLDTGKQAGPYLKNLRRCYAELNTQLWGRALPLSMWRFLRLRPCSFPTLRISQFAHLIQLYWPLLPHVLEAREASHWDALFRLKASTYWDMHYCFGKASVPGEKWTGRQFRDMLLINAVQPCLMTYGILRKDKWVVKHAQNLLPSLKAESNQVMRIWGGLGLKVHNAAQSQALYYLYLRYCKQKRCGNCLLGKHLRK